MSKVFIVNRSFHNFEAAALFGDVVFLSDGPMGRYETNNIARQFDLMLKDSGPNDFLVPCSLNIMNIVASALFVSKHKKLNLLLFRDGRYIERKLVFE